jgi:hypothetical protein
MSQPTLASVTCIACGWSTHHDPYRFCGNCGRRLLAAEREDVTMPAAPAQLVSGVERTPWQAASVLPKEGPRRPASSKATIVTGALVALVLFMLLIQACDKQAALDHEAKCSEEYAQSHAYGSPVSGECFGWRPNR